jgi:tetratricopeptide (TPR) repeat protein
LGIVYSKKGDLKISIQKLREAIKLGKKSSDVYYLIAAMHDRLGMYSEAIKEYLFSYSLDKKNTQVFYQIAVIKKQLYKYSEAIAYYNKFINLSKNLVNLGSLRAKAMEEMIEIKKKGLPKGAYIKYISENFDPFNYKINYPDEFTSRELKFQGKIIAEFSSVLGKYKIMVSMLSMKKDETIDAAYFRGWGWDISKKGLQDNVIIKDVIKLETKNSKKFNIIVKGVEEGKPYYDYLTSIIFVSTKNYDRALFEIQVPTNMTPRGVLNNMVLSFKFI